MILDWVFDDKRVAAFVLFLWMVGVVWVLESQMDLLHSDFFAFGPGPRMKFMTVTVDTWHKWGLLATATFFTTTITDFMSDAIVPWLQNTIQDHKTKYLPYSKHACFLISQTWSVYCSVMSIFGVALMMSQIDLLLIRMCADLIVNTYTSFKFMRGKCTDPVRYWVWTEDKLRELESLHTERSRPQSDDDPRDAV